MADTFSRERRSEIMGRITSKNTRPEVRVRSALHLLGFRFRLHRKDLPGKPDIVLPKWKTVIFVHGCFWHQHLCIDGHVPKSNSDYWRPKLAKNVERDTRNQILLRELGWRTIVIWECQTAKFDELAVRLQQELTSQQV